MILRFEFSKYFRTRRSRAELDERIKDFPRFWTEPNVLGQRLRLSKALTALEVAAALGHEDLFSMDRDAGADETAWTSVSEARRVDFDDTKPSFMSTPSPVHEANATGQPAMLHRLLHTPDVWTCITSLHQHEDLDKHLCSPIFDIHPLHFAVGRHDVDLLSRLSMALSSAGTTALRQNLLHIASLPMMSECIDKENHDSVRSIHCAPTLIYTWLSHQFPSPLHLDPNKDW
ncbi:hypothetical protein ETB97_005721 [Aspergillus alliaceus]|uniref:Uncharacterized protein n=1 Tax=Petromyces alliaceus TaxID=209559 RepID=A0A8H6E2Y6_PETAA|nr:hypothetical protein ETB97_005721 [Aspergillus burnettii]